MPKPISSKNRKNLTKNLSNLSHLSRRARAAVEFKEQAIKKRNLFSRFVIVRRNLPKISEITNNSLPKRNVLVLAPHPEEPVEKCFATISGFLKAGSNVSVHVLTTGEHGVELTPEKANSIRNTVNPIVAKKLSKIKIRLKELKKADSILGTKSKVHSMDFYNNKQVSKRDLALMKKIIDSGKWDVVIMPDRLDLQPTHAIVYDLALKYLKRKARREQKPIELWGFETTYHRHPLSELNQIVYYSGEVQATKMNAVQAHKSQEIRRGAYIVGRMAETERSSALAEEKTGFGSHVDFKSTQRLEAFSVNVLKPFGPFVPLFKRK